MSDGVSWYRAYFKDTYDTWTAFAGRVGVREVHDREDIVQQVFLELWKARGHEAVCPHRFALNAFMRTRVTHRMIDRWKAQRRRPEQLVGEFCQRLDVEAWPSADSAENWASVVDSAKWITELVNALSERERGHVVLVALGVGPQTRAELLGLSPGAERVRWHRLRKRLQDQLGLPMTGEQEATE